MTRRVRALAILLLLTAPIVACSSGDDSGSTSEPAAPSTTDVALPEDQQAYTSALVRAWGAGDRAVAGGLATPAVVDELFAAADPGDWEPVGCDNAGPVPACTFSSDADDRRLVLFYDAELLARARAVVDLELLDGAA